MQISATTLLAQQAARVAPKPAQPADAFAPLNFKQAAKTSQVALPESQAAAPAKTSAGMSSAPTTGYARPGTKIDITV